ncbi:helix-turn-helix domain-containing protein [Herbidospora sp. NBRC 101105]|uniref:helix-turn-helix domain-containing protein n=1 Tax=Herbidospora sp. NBRC 101105 TaxID=3032195 RepID=UPI0024A573B6|nr:helix-turn-helix domain-containing protein [Herbidospora sp. NBRC 101105]GLX98888.1 cyclic diguanylate phosphodiesterase [Herbidospora sp. NBRC 101105]
MNVFLELLAREASAVEFEGPVLQARAAGADPATLEELEREKVAALRIRAVMRRRARREAELSALFDTAKDLAGLRDIDAVLAAIVRRARGLLGTDVAYLTLNDAERGDTYMRVTDGVITARFRSVRLPLGAGLGGLVAQTGEGYATSDYFADERFRHTGTIDDAVTEEGLVAILGVPLRLGGQVIGVLFAADRGVRPFAREEIALLASLAAHASVAIDTARLLEETRAALTELSEANRLIRNHSTAIERAADAHDRMTGLVLRGGGVEDVAAVVTEVIGGRLTVLDGTGEPLVGDPGDVDPGVSDAARASRALGRSVERGRNLIASVDVGGSESTPLCTLVLRTAGPVADTDRRILERAALVTALLLLFRRSVADAEGRVRGELLDDLIARPDLAGLPDRARRLGLDLAEPHVLVSVTHDGQRERAAFWASSEAALTGGLATARGDEVVLLLPGDKPGVTAKRMAAELSASLGRPATAGAAQAGSDVAAAYEEARRCASALLALGRAGDGAGAAELGFVGLVIGEGRDVAGFVHGAIGAVRDYDEKKGTQLVQTLVAYFACGGQLTRTAEALHIHVNTVTQRLDRIRRLLGDDWQEPERALEIQLALRLGSAFRHPPGR